MYSTCHFVDVRGLCVQPLMFSNPMPRLPNPNPTPWSFHVCPNVHAQSGSHYRLFHSFLNTASTKALACTVAPPFSPNATRVVPDEISRPSLPLRPSTFRFVYDATSQALDHLSTGPYPPTFLPPIHHPATLRHRIRTYMKKLNQQTTDAFPPDSNAATVGAVRLTF